MVCSMGFSPEVVEAVLGAMEAGRTEPDEGLNK